MPNVLRPIPSELHQLFHLYIGEQVIELGRSIDSKVFIIITMRTFCD